ncbi:MAG: integral rane sensor signal transduction histidine kinase, partial [Verrucomicrobiales bacterium]|nr:integral rane sensor signal transduction histidine kinase [Verrucomicrobiales bacterium]
MTSFRNLSLTWKLTAVIMLTTWVGLLISCAGFIAYESLTFRENATRQVETVANILSENLVAPLIFKVPSDAEEALRALRKEKSIDSAHIYDRSNNLFASYGVDAITAPDFRNTDAPQTILKATTLTYVGPITLNSERLGTMVLVSDLHGLRDRFRLYGIIVIGVLTIAAGFSFICSRSLQAKISDPILSLSKVARLISTTRNFDVRVAVDSQDELGQMTVAFNNMLDTISAQNQTLKDNGKRYKSLVSAMTAMVWTSDSELNFFAPQETWTLFTGQDEPQFRGHGWLNAIHPVDRPQIEPLLHDGVDHHVKQFEIRLWNEPAMDWRWSIFRAVPIFDDENHLKEWVGTVTDVHERRRAEEEIKIMNVELENRVSERTAQLTATNQELEAFTYSVSHDLRSPLRHIVAFGEILQEEYSAQLEPAAKDYLIRMMRDARNMKQLVDDLLNLAKIGAHELIREKIVLPDLIKDIIFDLQPEIGARVVHWQVQPLPAIDGDPGLIRQVFTNLLSNSLKYSRRVNPTVIEIGSFQSDLGERVIFVKDNGVGFSMDHVDRLFRVFNRLHKAADFEGTGVGLATV